MTLRLSQVLSQGRWEHGRPAPEFWILVATVAGVPLALAPGLHFLDVTPKLLLLIGGACLVWLALVAGNRFPARRQQSAVYLWLLGALALLALLATVFSLDPVLSLAGSDGRRIGLPAWLACLALAAAVPVVVGGDLQLRRGLLGALVLAALLAAAYGFAQYLGYDPWINPELYRAGSGELQIVRPPSTLGHADWFALFSLLAMFSAAGLALSGSTTRARLGWAVAGLILAMALVVAGSRGAWLGGAAGAVLLFARIGLRRPLLAGLLATAVFAAALVVSPWGRPVRNRFRSFADDPGVTARVLVWRDSLRLIAAHPLLGAGPDTYELAFPSFQSIRLAELAPDSYAESPHNLFLDYAASAGIPAGLVFVALLAMALGKYAVSSRTEALEAGLLAALVAGLVAMQFIADTLSSRLALLTIVALSISIPAAPARRAVRRTVGAIAVACAVLALLFGIRLVSADRAVLQAHQAANRGDIKGALQAGLRAQQAFPWTGVHAFAVSRIVAQLAVAPSTSLTESSQTLAAAEESTRAGLLHSSQPQMVNVQLASLLVLQDQRDEAEAALTEAARAAPVWYRPRWLLAVLLAGQGQLRPAAEQAEAALQLGAGKHPEIAEACLKILQLAAETPVLEEFDPSLAHGLHLSYDDAVVHPLESRPDTPNGHWAFPYRDHSLITLARSDLTFGVDIPVMDVPSQPRFRATVRMPLEGADPAWAVVRVNGEQLFSKLLGGQQEVNLDFSRFVGMQIELQLAATPSPQGDRASWVQWVDPRIVIEPAR